MNSNDIVEIVGYKITKINFFPKNIVEEIMQNIIMIITTAIGSVPLDRAFGVNADYIDDPDPRAMMKLTIFITESIQEFEPRVEVKEVDFIPSAEKALDGKMIPKVRVRILDEYLSA